MIRVFLKFAMLVLHNFILVKTFRMITDVFLVLTIGRG